MKRYLDIPSVALTMPEWLAEELGDVTLSYRTDQDKMRLALKLLARQIEENSGGPFASVIFEAETGSVFAAGVNRVVPCSCSIFHGEATAIMLAQAILGSYDLANKNLELFTTAAPCAQCFGIIWFSGIKRVVSAATVGDVEGITGFNEGPLHDRWRESLLGRAPLPAVEVVEEVLRADAVELLKDYVAKGGVIYSPGSTTK